MLPQIRRDKTFLWLITSHKIDCEQNIRGLIIKSKTKANNKKEKKQTNNISYICNINQELDETYHPISQVNITLTKAIVIYNIYIYISLFESQSTFRISMNQKQLHIQSNSQKYGYLHHVLQCCLVDYASNQFLAQNCGCSLSISER